MNSASRKPEGRDKALPSVAAEQATHISAAPSELCRGAAHRLPARLLGSAWAAALRISCATWRKDLTGFDTLDRLIAERRPHLLAFWHGKYLPLLPLLRGRQACVFTSVSARGDVLVNVMRQFGFASVQLPDHGRHYSLELMRRASAEHIEGGVAVDGPLGPYHVVKRGVVQVASELGLVVVPLSVAARPKHVRHRRWDRLEVPWPFAKVSLIVGTPISIPPHVPPRELRRWMKQLRDTLRELDERAEQRVSSP